MIQPQEYGSTSPSPRTLSIPVNGVDIPVSDESAKLVTESVLDAATGVAMAEGTKLKNLAMSLKDGPLSIRVASYLGGVVMVVTGFMSFLGNFFTLSPVAALIQVYIFLFGWVIVFVEARNSLLPEWILEKIYQYALFITMVTGRGVFYIFCGTLCLAQFNMLDIVLGVYMAGLGGLMIYYGKKAIEKMKAMRVGNHSEAELQRMFMQYDADNSGSLDSKEMAQMCKELGADLSIAELETAIIMLDKDHDGLVDWSEFSAWYKSPDVLLP